MKKLFIILVFLFPILVEAQILRMSSIVRPTGSSPSLSVSISSLSGFSTIAGTASSSQNFTISGTNLTAGATVTAPTNFEVSLDNSSFASSKSVSQSGGSLVSQPVTIYVRITVASSSGSVSGFVTIASTGATTKSVAVSGTVTSSSPSIVTGVSSLTGFSTIAGTASSSQNYSLTGSNLTADITINASSGCEVSLDNSSFASSKTATQSGGSVSTTVYVRLSASATAGTFSGTVSNSSTGATTQNVTVGGTVSSLQTGKFNFSVSASSVSGWTNFFGDPTASPSFTDAGTGWTLASVGAGWVKFGGFFGGLNNGATSASTDAVFSQASINSNLYTASVFGTNGYNLKFTNLPAGTYSIEILGSIQSSIFNNGGTSNFHVQFGTGSDNIGTPYNPNGSGATGNLVAMGPGTTGVATGTFNGTITSGQTINIGVCVGGTGGTLGYINGLTITKTN